MAPFGSIYTYPNNPRVAKAQAAANINGLELEIPEFKFGETNRTPEFLAKFPHGKVPAFAGADGTSLFESDAIAQYVAESGPAADQLIGATPAKRAEIRQWICFAQCELGDNLTKLILWRFGFSAFDETLEKNSTERLERGLRTLETQLQGRTWICSEKIDLSDITVAATLIWGFAHVIDAEMRTQYPNFMAWFERVTEVDAVKKAFGQLTFIEKRKVGGQK